jgi:hypothetical protein
MNFALAGTLNKLLKSQQLDAAIRMAEEALTGIQTTDFHKILGRNFLQLRSALAVHISEFDQSTQIILKKKRGFIKNLLASAKAKRPAAYNAEMNGFTINYDRWYVDLLSFEKMGGDNWEWTTDFYDSSQNDFTISGMEDIQAVFCDVHENNRFDEPGIHKAYEVCELLVILRLQELFSAVYKDSFHAWTEIPMFVMAHDYDFIYSPNFKDRAPVQ